MPATIRIAALVKQIPILADLELGADGRLRRDVGPLEMSAYCRRAVAKGVELARETGGTCTAITLGPPAAEDVLREAVAWGADDGVLVSGPEFAGSDTLATARALAAVVEQLGGFDLVLVGRNSLDADTGQVGPSLGELLGWPFLGAARELSLLEGGGVQVGCEHDSGRREAITQLPAVIACAERLCDPAKMPPPARAEVAAERIRVISAADLGAGPWGDAASRTTVGEVRVHPTTRAGRRLTGTVEEQVAQAVETLGDLWSDDARSDPSVASATREHAPDGGSIAVLVEPGRDRNARELLGEAAALVGSGGSVVAVAVGDGLEAETASTWGADRLVRLAGSAIPQDLATALAGWLDTERSWALLGPATLWGREILARVAARLDLGLTGDATGLEVVDGRLVAWKPAFGGSMLAAIRCRSGTQAATVRHGVMALADPRPATQIAEQRIDVPAVAPVQVLSETEDDDPDLVAIADVVIGVGTGVPPEEYELLEPLRVALGAELAASRRVTDKGWLPHSRQVGITGRHISPRLYLAIGIAGKANHMIGVRNATRVLAINTDPSAPVFDHADIGIIADWHEVLPLLTTALAAIAPDGP